MKILIIGGTNFIGPFVIRQLTSTGHQVTVFNRGKTEANLPPEVDRIIGDRANLKDFKTEFDRLKPDVVLDLIALTERSAKISVNTFKGIAKRLVVVSSMDVYRAYGIIRKLEAGATDPVPLTEDSPLREHLYPYRDLPGISKDISTYYEKILVEKVVMSDPDLPSTVIRLPMVYGPGDYIHRLYPYLRRMDDRRPVIILEKSIAKWRGSYGYVENIAAAIALTVVDEKAKNRIYHVADREVFSEAERINKIGEIVGWKGKVLSLSRKHFPAEWELDINTKQDWFVDSYRIRKELGYDEIVSLKEALDRTIKWQRKNPPQNTVLHTASYLLDYETEDLIMNDILSNLE